MNELLDQLNEITGYCSGRHVVRICWDNIVNAVAGGQKHWNIRERSDYIFYVYFLIQMLESLFALRDALIREQSEGATEYNTACITINLHELIEFQSIDRAEGIIAEFDKFFGLWVQSQGYPESCGEMPFEGIKMGASYLRRLLKSYMALDLKSVRKKRYNQKIQV